MHQIPQYGIHQHIQEAKEEGKKDIKDLDLVSNRSNYPMDPIVMPIPKEPLISFENKSIVPVVSQEDPSIEIPHIDFIFGDE